MLTSRVSLASGDGGPFHARREFHRPRRNVTLRCVAAADRDLLLPKTERVVSFEYYDPYSAKACLMASAITTARTA
jgi:hypothetical protein